MRRARLTGCLLALYLAASFAVSPTAADDAPLTEESVVRLFIEGMSVEQIVERIRDSEVRFDLSEGMQEELRIAGIPDAVRHPGSRMSTRVEPVFDEAAGTTIRRFSRSPNQTAR